MDTNTKYLPPEQIAHDILMAEIQQLLANKEKAADAVKLVDYYREQYPQVFQKLTLGL